MNLHDQRKNYTRGALLEDELPENPIHLFQTWYSEAQEHDAVVEANAMSVATTDIDGYPRNRIVLLKELSDEAFIFYTNYKSFKGQHIEYSSKAALHFFWPPLEKQIIIKCNCSKTSRAQTQEYFASRPRASQIGAWSSQQSAVIDSREALELQKKAIEKKFCESDIPAPPFWGGIRCSPIEIEFWQGRPGRLHDRIVYSRDKGGVWITNRLQP